MPTQRGNVSLSNLQVLNAILYVAEHGCNWLGMPKRFGNWHTIYTRMNRWAKSGVLDRAFAQLQLAQVLQIKIEAASLDSTSARCIPMAQVLKKKRSASYRQVPWRMEHQDRPSRRGRAHGRNVLVVAGSSARCTRGSRVAKALGRAESTASAHGSRL